LAVNVKDWREILAIGRCDLIYGAEHCERSALKWTAAGVGSIIFS